MTGLAFVFGVAPMVIAAGASAKSQQALGTGVMGGMIAVVVLALLMVPVFFVAVQRAFSRSETEPKVAASAPARCGCCRSGQALIAPTPPRRTWRRTDF